MTGSANNHISIEEEEARSLLEAAIFFELPDIEVSWKYYPTSKEHSCRISKGNAFRSYRFSRETLLELCEKPDDAPAMVQDIVPEVRRYVL